MVARMHVASKYYIRPDEQCSHWVGAYRQQTYLMLLLDVQSPDGEPGLESRDARNIYYLQRYTSTTVYAACAYLMG